MPPPGPGGMRGAERSPARRRTCPPRPRWELLLPGPFLPPASLPSSFSSLGLALLVSLLTTPFSLPDFLSPSLPAPSQHILIKTSLYRIESHGIKKKMRCRGAHSRRSHNSLWGKPRFPQMSISMITKDSHVRGDGQPRPGGTGWGRGGHFLSQPRDVSLLFTVCWLTYHMAKAP